MSRSVGPNRRPTRATSRRGALRAAPGGLALTAFARPLARGRPASPVATAVDWTAVDDLARGAEQMGAVVGIGIGIDGADDAVFSRHGDRRFRAASTVKVPIMIAAYRAIERGTLSLDDRHILRNEDRVPGSGVLAHLRAGLDMTVADLLYLMIAVSDNSATNLVIDRVGLAAVNATMRSLGMRDSVLARPMLGRLPNPDEPENWATPRDFAAAIRAIVAGEAASPEHCAAMLATLEQQNATRRISRFLVEPGLRWGTKPGDLPGVINDVGFVASDRGSLAIAVFTEDLPGLDEAERAIGSIAREALALTGVVPVAPDSAAGA